MTGSPRDIIANRKAKGELCCGCSEILDAPDKPGLHTCPACSQKTKRVYIQFHESSHWFSTFREENLQVSIGGRTFRTDPDKPRELQQTYGVNKGIEDINILESAIRSHRGGFWLNLPLIHYERLKRR